jgi:hypothetical protein
MYDGLLTLAAGAMRFVITSGTGIREIVDERPDARSAHEHVLSLISHKRPCVRIFDPDGNHVSVEKLRDLARREAVTTGSR